ncbi:NAD(P)H-binding protein [Streptomyces sp. JNUCC 64]
MTITVLGATGATGRLIVDQLIGLGHSVRGAVRKPEKAARSRGGVEFVPFDLASPGDGFAAVFDGTGIVVNAAATGSMMPRQADKIDRQGVIAAIDAAARAGVKQWVQVSMMGSGDSARVPAYLRATGRAKHAADLHLAESGMTWTVVRPPWLTDGPATGRVTVGDQVAEGSLSRADLAAVAVAALTVPAAHNRMFEVTGGGGPIERSLTGLA